MSEPLCINLYDDITPGVARDIANALLMNPAEDVVLRINSPGGNVTDGYAIASALRSHPGKKTAVIEGACASAATFPACACDEIHMHPESFFMIHGPWGEVSGGPEAMSTQSELLAKMADLCAGMYQRKSGASEQQVRDWMARDTWMTPAEAKEAGFCDQILDASAPPMARAAAQRYMARLRPAKNTKDKPLMATKSEVFPDHLAKKLAKHGLGDDMSPEMISKAYRAYMDDTDDGPDGRREMSRAVAGVEKVEGDQDLGDNPTNPIEIKGNAKAKDDEESETDAAKDKKRMRADADMDPAVAKLVSALTKSQADTAKEVADLKAEKRAREIKDLHAYAKTRGVSTKDADEYLELAGNDIARATALVAKHPEKTAMTRITQGGRPLGSPPDSGLDAEVAPMASDGRHQLHGFALSKIARAEFSKKEPPKGGQAAFHALAKLQRDTAKSRPDTWG